MYILSLLIIIGICIIYDFVYKLVMWGFPFHKFLVFSTIILAKRLNFSYLNKVSQFTM